MLIIKIYGEELEYSFKLNSSLWFHLFLQSQKNAKFNFRIRTQLLTTMKYFNQLVKGLLLVALFSFLGACAASNASGTAADGSATASTKKGKKAKKEVYSPTGEWAYDVETPDGGSSGTMTVLGGPGTYEVLLKTDQFGEIRVYDLEMTGESMMGKIDVAGLTAEVEGDFDGESFSGAVIMGDEVYPLEAIRTSKG